MKRAGIILILALFLFNAAWAWAETGADTSGGSDQGMKGMSHDMMNHGQMGGIMGDHMGGMMGDMQCKEMMGGGGHMMHHPMMQQMMEGRGEMLHMLKDMMKIQERMLMGASGAEKKNMDRELTRMMERVDKMITGMQSMPMNMECCKGMMGAPEEKKSEQPEK